MGEFKHWKAALFRKEQGLWSYIVEPIAPYWLIPLQIIFVSIFLLAGGLMIVASISEFELITGISGIIFLSCFMALFLVALIISYRNDDYLWFPKFCISDEEVKVISAGIGVQIFKQELKQVVSASLIKKKAFKKDFYQLILQLKDGRQRKVPYIIRHQDNPKVLLSFFNEGNQEESPIVGNGLLEASDIFTEFKRKDDSDSEVQSIILARKDPEEFKHRIRVVGSLMVLAIALASVITGIVDFFNGKAPQNVNDTLYYLVALELPLILWFLYEQYCYRSILKVVISSKSMTLKRVGWPLPLTSISYSKLSQIDVIEGDNQQYYLRPIAKDGKAMKLPISFEKHDQAEKVREQLLEFMESPSSFTKQLDSIPFLVRLGLKSDY